MRGKAKSITAIWVSGAYLILALAAWALPLLATSGENLAAVFLVILAQPWASLLVWVMDRWQIESFVFNMAFMLAGIILNTWIIYHLVSWIARPAHRKPPG